MSARSGAEPNATARPASNVPSSAAYDDIEEPGEAGAPSSFPKRQARVSIRDAASRAASGCMLPRPVQPLTVSLTFSPKGDVTKVVIPPGFIAGTEECLKEYFGGIEVRPFDGEPIEVHRTVFRNR